MGHGSATREPPFGAHARSVADLQESYPAWNIWTVRVATGHTWHAYRRPVLTTSTAGELAAGMAKVEMIDPLSLVDTLTLDVVPLDGRERFPVLDRLKAEMSSTFPNWHIVYRPDRHGPVEWESYRHPLLHAATKAELAEYMTEVQGSGEVANGPANALVRPVQVTGPDNTRPRRP